jgi:hypothetical protein
MATTPEPQNAGAVNQDALNARIAELEAKLEAASKDADRITALEEALAASQAARAVATSVPMDAGGPGTEISETWSQYDQELMWFGEHPSQQAS